MLETRSTHSHRERGEVSLARLAAARVDLGQLLTIGVRLADALAAMHARGVAHLGLRPTEIRIRDDHLELGPPSAEPPAHSPGNGRARWSARDWPYLSPEQTGRLAVQVDHRSDLYTLGVILHELLTGHHPFSADDLPGWIHAHVAVQAPAASDIVPGLPRVLSDIVLRLLAKAPEDRYQTASGVRDDLARCLDGWRGAGKIEPFVIGRMDPPPPPRITAALHGRDDEIDRLVAALARAEVDERAHLVLVSGPAGVGKTALVGRVHRIALDQGAVFASGKGAPGAENEPLHAAQQALDGALGAALESNAFSHAELRERLESALGINAPLLTAVLPELARTIGARPEPADLEAPEAERRFLATLGSYLGALARPRHPLVLFFDDLQWADSGTLKVLEHAVTDPAVHHTLVIAAYRSGDGDEPAPITGLLARLSAHYVEPTRIEVRLLTLEAVTRWVADVLRRREDDVAALAKIVHERSGGSALFVAHFLEALYHDGSIRYSVERSQWLWDLDRIRAQRYADDVAELIAARIRTLRPEAQEALRLFAAQGASAHIGTLEIVLGAGEPAVLDRLREPFAARLVARVGDEIRFLHDRIHQTAYELTPAVDRPALHLSIGRALLARIPPTEIPDHVFEIVRHFDLAGPAIRAPSERAEVAALDLTAGRTARASNDTPSAIAFFVKGIARLGPEGWERHYDLAFQLHLSLARARFASGGLAEADALCRTVLRHARSDVDRAKAHVLLADTLVLQGAISEAAEACLGGLRELGFELPARPTDAQVETAYSEMLARLGDDPVRALRKELPPMRSEPVRAACDLVAALQPPAAYLDWNLIWLSSCVGVDLTLRHGRTSSSASAFGAFAVGLADRYRRYREAFAFGEAAYRMALRTENAAHRPRASFAFVALISYLELPLRRCVAMLRDELAHATAIGDLAFACYHAKHVTDFRLVAGDPLEQVGDEAKRAAQLARGAGYTIVADMLRSRARLVDALRGAPVQDQREPLLEHAFPMVRFHLAFHDLVRAYVLGDLSAAAAASERARELVGAVAGFLLVPEWRFYAALTDMARIGTPAIGAAAVPDAVRGHHRALAALAASSEASFADRVALLGAELARLEGDAVAAQRGYEDAIRRARESQALHVEAFACERAASFHASRGLPTIASAYFAAAHHAFELWGAHARARMLLDQHPELATAAARAARPVGSAEAAGMLKAAEAITGALLLPDLHARLLEVAIEQAGAQRGVLLVATDEGLVVAAARGVDAASFGEISRRASATAVPLSMCDAARRTQRAVLLADATKHHRYTADPYFVRIATRSALALPIVREGRSVALLYLENALVAGAFSTAQMAVLDVLASQAAISLENARLYSGLRQEIVDRRAAEARLEQSEQLLQAVIDNVTAVVWVKDLEGRYTLVNRRFADVVHLEPSEVVGMTDRRLFATAVADAMLGRDAQAIAEGRTIQSEESIPHDDGVHDYLTERCPLRDASGRIHAVCAIATDVTARNRAARALRHSLSLTEATIESTADGILVVDRDGRMVRTNRRFLEMWRIPDGVLATRDDARAVAYVADQLEEPEAFLASVRALYASPDETVFDRLRFRDGRVFERYSTPQRLGDDIVGRVWSFRDVTERVRAQEQRDRLLDEEKRARASAENAVRMRDEFLSIASHELRTPLTSLQLAIDGLSLGMSRTGRIDPAQLDRVLTVSKRQIRRLTALVGLLLDVSRFRAGRLELHREDVDLGAAVTEVTALLADEVRRSGSTLHVPPHERVVGRWDALRIEQVVTNLLTNAIKFGAGKPIEVLVERLDDDARLVVRDHGIGIPPDVQRRLFAPFERGVSWKHYGGLGLGLFITRVVVEAHGGRIDLESEPGRGTTFTVVLPLTPREGEEATSVAAADDGPQEAGA